VSRLKKPSADKGNAVKQSLMHYENANVDTDDCTVGMDTTDVLCSGVSYCVDTEEVSTTPAVCRTGKLFPHATVRVRVEIKDRVIFRVRVRVRSE